MSPLPPLKINSLKVPPLRRYYSEKICLSFVLGTIVVSILSSSVSQQIKSFIKELTLIVPKHLFG